MQNVRDAPHFLNTGAACTPSSINDSAFYRWAHARGDDLAWSPPNPTDEEPVMALSELTYDALYEAADDLGVEPPPAKLGRRADIAGTPTIRSTTTPHSPINSAGTRHSVRSSGEVGARHISQRIGFPSWSIIQPRNLSLTWITSN